MSEPVAASAAPVGIVRTDADDKLDKVYEALDAQDFRNKFLEGVELTADERLKREAFLHEIARECNARLAGRVRITGGFPELMGFGARFMGTDSDGREYTIDFHRAAEDRMFDVPEDREAFGREVVDLIVTEVLAQRERYLSRMNGAPKVIGRASPRA